MQRLVPDGGPPAGGAVLRGPEHPAGGRPAGAAAGPRVAVGRPDPRAEQPGRRRRPRDRGAAGTGRRDAAQAGLHREGPVRAGDPGGPDQAAGARRGAGGEGAGAQPDRGLRPRGRRRRLARRPRHRRRLGSRAGLRAGRAGRRLARPGRGLRGLRRPGRRGAVAELHRRDRAADERDRGLDHPDLDAGGRGQAVLPARPRALPGRGRARAARQHPGHAGRQDR